MNCHFSNETAFHVTSGIASLKIFRVAKLLTLGNSIFVGRRCSKHKLTRYVKKSWGIHVPPWLRLCM